MDQLQRQRQEQQQQQQQQHPSSLLGAPPQKDASNSSAATTTTTTTTEVGNGVDDDDDVDADERKVSAILHLFDNIVSPVRQASLIHSLLSRCHAASRDLLIRSATTAAATVAAASSGSVSAPSAPASALASGSLGARPDYAPSTREPTPALEEEVTALVPVKQSWKRIYAERLLVERKWRRGQYDLRELEGHTGPVLCTHLDECLGLLVSGSADHTLKVWELDSGQCIGTLVGHTGEVTGVQLDGKKIVSGSMDGTVRIWNRLTLECIHVLQGHRGGVRALHIDGKVLATGSSDATIRIWDVSAGMSYTLRGHEGPVHRVSVFRRGGDQQPLPLLFSCSSDGTARLWDLNARSCLRVFSGHAGEVLDMQLSAPLARKQLAPSESRGAEPRLVTGSADGTVRVWDIETAECLHVLRAFNDGGGGGVFCVAADSLRVAAGSAGGGIGLWDVESGDPLYSVARPSIAGLEPMVAQLAVPSNGALPVPASALLSLSISDTKLVSGGADGVCRILSFAI
ncbi:hypothetical protein HK405_003032 [Cladochytrium tenue]|nr:hypothetical protein HK405_003032 [Cladochytrium tenue]